MATVEVKNLENKTVGTVELADAVFACRANPGVLHEVVRNYLAGLRGGTHQTKTRGEVRGSGRKLWRQKGTGRARIGSIRSPLWRHGGTVHGPQPRDYSYRLPRKMQLGALRSALSAKLRDGELKVVQAFEFADHKTKTVAAALAKLEAGKKVLLVDNAGNRNLELGARNIDGLTLLPTREVTTYHLLEHQRVLLSEAAARKLSEALSQ
jgi:large subunit ribosomal protein L4